MQILPNINNVRVAYMTNGLGGLRSEDNIGSLTRIKEAISSVKILGYEKNQVINCELPFYYTKTRKITNDDITKMETILSNYFVNHLFVCVDRDPKGTHIKCAKLLQKCRFPDTIKYIWLYKSAWGNWSDNEISSNFEVYISKHNFNKKLLSIDMHISQIEPLVIKNKKIESFKDIVKIQNASEKYPGHYQEKFKILDLNEFKSININ